MFIFVVVFQYWVIGNVHHGKLKMYTKQTFSFYFCEMSVHADEKLKDDDTKIIVQHQKRVFDRKTIRMECIERTNRTPKTSSLAFFFINLTSLLPTEAS